MNEKKQKDSIRSYDSGTKIYDPLLGFARNTATIPGYNVWPKDLRFKDADIRMVVVGGSTSLWSCCPWPRYFGEMITERKACKLLLFNGAVQGYSTSQELLKLLRDIPAINPEVAVSFSGINDAGFFHMIPRHPFVHSYQKTVAQYLLKTADAYEGFTFGVPWSSVDTWRIWIQNMRLMNAVCKVYETRFFGFLQPTMVYGGYEPNEEEKKAMEEYAYRFFPGSGMSYHEQVTTFYDHVRAEIESDSLLQDYLFDLSNLYKGMTGLYRDYRHQNDEGCRLIADEVFKLLESKGVFDR